MSRSTALIFLFPREANQTLHAVLALVGHFAQGEYCIFEFPLIRTRPLTLFGARPWPLCIGQFQYFVVDGVSAPSLELPPFIHLKPSLAVEAHGIGRFLGLKRSVRKLARQRSRKR